jgi:hypothetical protein
MTQDDKDRKPHPAACAMDGGDAGTKGTGSAGIHTDDGGDAGTKGTGSAGIHTDDGGDAGTKGTGSAG